MGNGFRISSCCCSIIIIIPSTGSSTPARTIITTLSHQKCRNVKLRSSVSELKGELERSVVRSASGVVCPQALQSVWEVSIYCHHETVSVSGRGDHNPSPHPHPHTLSDTPAQDSCAPVPSVSGAKQGPRGYRTPWWLSQLGVSLLLRS